MSVAIIHVSYDRVCEMRTEASWREQQRLLKAAKALADFANLEPGGDERYRRANAEFLPLSWWTGPAWNSKVGTHTPWLRERDHLREAWAAEFRAATTLEL